MIGFGDWCSSLRMVWASDVCPMSMNASARSRRDCSLSSLPMKLYSSLPTWHHVDVVACSLKTAITIKALIDNDAAMRVKDSAGESIMGFAFFDLNYSI